MLAAILVSIGAVYLIGCAVTIYEICRAPIGPDENEQDNQPSK